MNLMKLMKALNVDTAALNFSSGSDTDVHIKLNGRGSTAANSCGQSGRASNCSR